MAHQCQRTFDKIDFGQRTPLKKARGSFINYVDQIVPNFDPTLTVLEWTIVAILQNI